MSWQFANYETGHRGLQKGSYQANSAKNVFSLINMVGLLLFFGVFWSGWFLLRYNLTLYLS